MKFEERGLVRDMAKRRSKPKKKQIEQYAHPDKERANNPPVGLVTPQTDPVEPVKKKYAYDPHLDPQLVWSGKAERTSFEIPTVSLHVHERILEMGVRLSGCTVHFVRPEMDEGPIIAQSCIPVHSTDDAVSLAARVLQQEHRIYPMVVKLIAERKVRVSQECVTINGAPEPTGSLMNPQIQS